MEINLRIHHHHFMTSKKHSLLVKTNTLHSILQLKQAIYEQYPSKINYFIAPPDFQQIMFHGQMWNDARIVNEMLLSASTATSHNHHHNNHTQEFPQNTYLDGQIVLIQWPRNDDHLRQIHSIISDSSNNIEPVKIAQKYKMSLSRVMKIVHFMEACGFVKAESNPPSKNNSVQSDLSALGTLEELKEDDGHNNDADEDRHFPFIEQGNASGSSDSSAIRQVEDDLAFLRGMAIGDEEENDDDDNDDNALFSTSFLEHLAASFMERIVQQDMDEIEEATETQEDEEDNENDNDDAT